ncbi:hypothetical protein MJG53_001285 [Ovis ammon polii x Ovis aries]|uniref:Uncharacterized protein n=2 Tax=Ovis TaxID=9935 RepID=A0AAD4UNY3_OVIAM|nr:hypothetical protein MG293_001031 [Ovis ammon polii]KAI4579415.1 hypothetical protein MJT46_000783 [Ovis ammon polii x Ovis aries]KAI4590236.1 hypothetical protein MJG53_001285 [Ovis ammon polii x Ovis aries]
MITSDMATTSPFCIKGSMRMLTAEGWGCPTHSNPYTECKKGGDTRPPVITVAMILQEPTDGLDDLAITATPLLLTEDMSSSNWTVVYLPE